MVLTEVPLNQPTSLRRREHAIGMLSVVSQTYASTAEMLSIPCTSLNIRAEEHIKTKNIACFYKYA